MENFSIKTTPFAYEGKDSIKIHIEGELNIKNAKEIKQKLIAAMGEYERYEVNLENITALDVTGIQLLIGIKKAVGKDKIQLHLNINKEIETTLAYSGMQQLLSP